MRTDTKATRKKIIAAAEKLFAERGIDAVSLNEINTASGQKNKSGLHYHFGNKAGLIQAIIDKHVPSIIEHRQQLLDDLINSGDTSMQGLVTALVLPVAEKLCDPDGGISYIRMNAQLVDSAEFGLSDLQKDYAEAEQESLITILTGAMPDMPEPLIKMRLLIVNGVLFHSLANYSRLIELDANTGSIEMQNIMAFTYNLVDSIAAILSAQPSKLTVDAVKNGLQDEKRDSSLTSSMENTQMFELDQN